MVKRWKRGRDRATSGKNGRELSGMITVEMAYIVPVILSVFFLSVLGIFYYHDKDVIASCAYEAAVVGSVKSREKDGVTEGLVIRVFQERVRGKCIVFSGVQAEAAVTEDMVKVTASAANGRMSLSVTEMARVTRPEEKIREHRRLAGWLAGD